MIQGEIRKKVKILYIERGHILIVFWKVWNIFLIFVQILTFVYAEKDQDRYHHF